MTMALVITVGSTADPILKAVEECRKGYSEVIVYLIYGRAFPEQKHTPFDVATEARARASAAGVPVRLFEVPDPENIDDALRVTREALKETAAAQRVIVNFTGGTKVLSAGAVHAALTAPLAGELILDYTGGVVRDDAGRVLRQAMRVKRSERTATDEYLQQVLDNVGRGAYREAALLARLLADLGRGGFVKKVVEALQLWDEFDYEPAVRLLQRLNASAKALMDDRQVAPLPALALRLLEPGNQLCAVLRPLAALQKGPGEFEGDTSHLPLLVADTLENARRRLEEGRATDTVLRCYRAVEVATQIRLLQHRLNPWHPNWTALPQDVAARCAAGFASTELPEKLALYNGLKCLEAFGQPLGEEGRKHLQDIQQSRNASYLEHGYQRLNHDAAHRLLGYAAELCADLLGSSLNALRESVRHAC